MGEGGTPPTYAGYLSSVAAEKTIAFNDTLDPSIYRRPEKFAQGWKVATAVQRDDAYRSFLNHPLPALRQAGGEYDRDDSSSLYSEFWLLRKPECCEGSSGMVGEKSRASKSSMDALSIGWESAVGICAAIVTGRSMQKGL